MLRFELDILSNSSNTVDGSPTTVATSMDNFTTNTLISLGELKIKEKMTINQVKTIVLNHMIELQKNDLNSSWCIPNSIEYIRLRDGKNKQPSGPLRDERIISRCLLNMDDGRRVIVQILKEPEIITVDDIVLSIRIASYYNKTLSKSLDIVINKNTTIIKLYEDILKKFPYLAEEVSMVENIDNNENIPICMKLIAIAKGYATGPPLTLKTALKLKWNDELIIKDILTNPTNTIDKNPMNLRDGSILIVRSQADFERARAVALAAKKLANNENNTVVIPSGTSSATRARLASRGGSRNRATSSSSVNVSREPSLKISSSSPTIGITLDSEIQSVPTSAGGGTIRMIQALKDSTNLVNSQ